MNIIALSLGLAPVPPLPPQVQQRQGARCDDDRRQHASEAAKRRCHGPTMRAEIRELLRSTGPATLLDVATYYGLSITNTKAHLARLLADKHIRVVKEVQRGRLTNVYHYAPAQP